MEQKKNKSSIIFTILGVVILCAGLVWIGSLLFGYEKNNATDDAQVEQYIKDYGLEDEVQNGNVKFWLMGYSRASVTANITAKRLVDKYGQNNDVYGYCFEVPQGHGSFPLFLPHWAVLMALVVTGG